MHPDTPTIIQAGPLRARLPVAGLTEGCESRYHYNGETRPAIFVNGVWQHYDFWQIVHVPDMQADPVWHARWESMWPLKQEQPIGLLRLFLVNGAVREVRYPDWRRVYAGRQELGTGRWWRRTVWRLRETGADVNTHVLVFDPDDLAYQWFTPEEYHTRLRAAQVREAAERAVQGTRPPRGSILTPDRRAPGLYLPPGYKRPIQD